MDDKTKFKIKSKVISDLSSTPQPWQALMAKLAYHDRATTILSNQIVEAIHFGKIPDTEIQEALEDLLENLGTPSLNTTLNLEKHLKAGGYNPDIYNSILDKYDDLASTHQGGAISARRQNGTTQNHHISEPDR